MCFVRHEFRLCALTLTSLVFADERRRAHSWIGKFQVLVKIVQTVEEVPHVTSEYREYAIVTVLTDESYEVHAHLVEELFFRHAEYLERMFNECSGFICEKTEWINQVFVRNFAAIFFKREIPILEVNVGICITNLLSYIFYMSSKQLSDYHIKYGIEGWNVEKTALTQCILQNINAQAQF